MSPILSSTSLPLRRLPGLISKTSKPSSFAKAIRRSFYLCPPPPFLSLSLIHHLYLYLPPARLPSLISWAFSAYIVSPRHPFPRAHSSGDVQSSAQHACIPLFGSKPQPVEFSQQRQSQKRQQQRRTSAPVSSTSARFSTPSVAIGSTLVPILPHSLASTRLSATRHACTGV